MCFCAVNFVFTRSWTFYFRERGMCSSGFRRKSCCQRAGAVSWPDGDGGIFIILPCAATLWRGIDEWLHIALDSWSRRYGFKPGLSDSLLLTLLYFGAARMWLVIPALVKEDTKYMAMRQVAVHAEFRPAASWFQIQRCRCSAAPFSHLHTLW